MHFEVFSFALPPCMEMCALSDVYTTYAADAIIMEMFTLLLAGFVPHYLFTVHARDEMFILICALFLTSFCIMLVASC